ncbi:MAG: PilZ domain-containing protein [Aquificae bacterium]|nr:PilZ domain-containing protein [Aquificota bacterium]
MERLKDFLSSYRGEFLKSLEKYAETGEGLKEARSYGEELYDLLLTLPDKYEALKRMRELLSDLSQEAAYILFHGLDELFSAFQKYVGERKEWSKETLRELGYLMTFVEDAKSVLLRQNDSGTIRMLVNHIKHLEEELKEKDNKLIARELELTKVNNEEIELLYNYRGLPLQGKAKVTSVEDGRVTLQVGERCLIPAAVSQGEILHAVGGSLSRPVKLKMGGKKNRTLVFFLEGYDERFAERRQHIRVRLDDQSLITLLKDRNLRCRVLDISVGGVSVLLREPAVREGDIVVFSFNLGDNHLEVLGECRYTLEREEGIKAGFRFLNLDRKQEETLSRFVLDQQLRILKMLKEKFHE